MRGLFGVMYSLPRLHYISHTLGTRPKSLLAIYIGHIERLILLLIYNTIPVPVVRRYTATVARLETPREPYSLV